jgi:hypothetical protein
MMTAPGIVAHALDDPCLDGIAMDVSNELQEVGITVDQRGVVTTFEKVPGRGQLRLHGTREFGGDVSHGIADRLGARLQEQMNVIGHPAVGVYPRAEALDGTRDDGVEEPLIALFDEDRAPMIAPQSDVIEAAG